MDVEFIKMAARLENGRRYTERETEIDPASVLLLQKAASAEDPELLRIASSLDGDTLTNYEALGGKYKAAFGQPMFQMQAPQMGAQPGAGGPAAAGGMPHLKPAGAPGAGPAGAPGAGVKPPGMGAGAGAGSTNPMKRPSTPQIPGAGAQASK